MANSAFTHNPSITVPGSSTNTALVRWSGTGADTFLDSTIIVGATTMGLAADTDLLTFGNGTLAITGTVTGITTITATTFSGALSGNASGTAAGLSTALVVASGGTNTTSYTKGDVLIASAGTTLTKLGIGSNTHVLTADSNEATGVKWAAAAAGGPTEATQANIEDEITGTYYAPPDLIKHSPGVAKVWGHWEQAGAHSLHVSYNYTSVTDGSAAGDTDHVFDVDFSSDNYVLVFGGEASYVIVANGQAAGTLTTLTKSVSGNTATDVTDNYLAGFGDQA